MNILDIFQKMNTLVFAIFSIIKWTKFHFSSTIITGVTLFVHVIYSAADHFECETFVAMMYIQIVPATCLQCLLSFPVLKEEEIKRTGDDDHLVAVKKEQMNDNVMANPAGNAKIKVISSASADKRAPALASQLEGRIFWTSPYLLAIPTFHIVQL